MLTITAQALAVIKQKDRPVFLDLPKLITNCCFSFQEGPSVRFGEPRDIRNYEKKAVQDVTVFVPNRLPEIPLTIAVSRFLCIERLVVEGWRFF